MKQSHLITPRTLADCEFRTGYISHEKRHGYSPAWWVCMGVIALLTIVIIGATA